MDIHGHIDLEPQKKSDHRKKELTKEIEEMQLFMYAMIHDLKAPISNLNSIFSLIKSEVSEEKPLLMEKAEVVVHNMKDTIDNLNKLLVLKNGKQEDIKRITLSKLLNDLLVSEISRDLDSPNLMANFEKCPYVFYPETYLKCILSNLINNAVKYRSDKRPLEIYLCSQKLGEDVLLTVRDNGQGINMVLEGRKLFKPFKRLSNSKEGSGLGLYLIKGLVEKNGGHIIVDSKQNVGTTFTLYLKEYKP